MAWSHCGRRLADDQPCGGCGHTKRTHTVRFDRTRVLTVRGKARASVLSFRLVDDRDRPLGGRRFRVESPDGLQVVEGVLEPDGSASVPGWRSDTARLLLLDLDASYLPWARGGDGPGPVAAP